MPDVKLTALTETSVPAVDDQFYTVDVSDTTDDPAGSSRSLSLTRLGAFLSPATCQGRLTTESGVPVSTSDRQNQSTIYFTPFQGNRICVFDGTRWKLYVFTELSLALSGLTSGKNYDVFVYDNAGTLTLELSAAWTNDTTRADALTTQDEVHVKSGATTRRHLGTIRTTGTTTTEDSGGGGTSQVGGKRFVWNRYHQVRRHLAVKDTSSGWSYATATWRQANAAAGNKVEWVFGDSTIMVRANLSVRTYAGSGFSVSRTGLGLDSITSPTGFYDSLGMNGISSQHNSHYAGCPGIGYHYLAWLEVVYASTMEFGDSGGACGIAADIWG